MKICFLTNNDISKPLYNKLKKNKEYIFIYSGKITPKYIFENKIDFIISYNYQHIIKQDVLDVLPNKVINLHVSLLPWNRGSDPNLWSIIKNTPKGVTIHNIEKGLDTGDILVQKEVTISDSKTLGSSYEYLHENIQSLFIDNWEDIKSNKIIPKKQTKEYGSKHLLKELDEIKKIIQVKGWDITIKEFKKMLKEKKYEF